MPQELLVISIMVNIIVGVGTFPFVTPFASLFIDGIIIVDSVDIDTDEEFTRFGVDSAEELSEGMVID